MTSQGGLPWPLSEVILIVRKVPSLSSTFFCSFLCLSSASSSLGCLSCLTLRTLNRRGQTGGPISIHGIIIKSPEPHCPSFQAGPDHHHPSPGLLQWSPGSPPTSYSLFSSQWESFENLSDHVPVLLKTLPWLPFSQTKSPNP